MPASKMPQRANIRGATFGLRGLFARGGAGAFALAFFSGGTSAGVGPGATAPVWFA